MYHSPCGARVQGMHKMILKMIGAAMHSSEASSAWLGRKDSNLRMAASKAAALPLGDSPRHLE